MHRLPFVAVFEVNSNIRWATLRGDRAAVQFDNPLKKFREPIRRPRPGQWMQGRRIAQRGDNHRGLGRCTHIL